jgi:hypothetical protein
MSNRDREGQAMIGGRRWRRGAALGAACAALAGLVSCSPGDPRPGHTDSAVLSSRAYAALGSGTLYLLLGNQNISANLWQVDVSSGRTRQLTFNRPEYGISNFSASPAGLVMGDAATGVDMTEVMQGGRPRSLGGGIGNSPQISEAGEIAVAADNEQGVRRGPWSRDRILLWPSPTARYHTIYQARPRNLITISWSPDGRQILAIDGPDDLAFTHLLVVDTRGRVVRRLVTLPGAPDIYAWGPPGLAIGNFQSPGPNEILSLSGRVLDRLPAGWVAGCWNPAGTTLLVMRRSQRQIGLWRPSRPSRVENLGALPARMQECSWISRPAAGA